MLCEPLIICHIDEMIAVQSMEQIPLADTDTHINRARLRVCVLIIQTLPQFSVNGYVFLYLVLPLHLEVKFNLNASPRNEIERNNL